jgi:hypothetical protein
MAFAITLETADLNYLGGAITAADVAQLSQADKNLAKKYWAGGIKNWAIAPLWGADPYCTQCRVVVVTYGTGAEFLDLCRRIAAVISIDAGHGDTQYLYALVEDMALTDLHEPWP